MIKLTNAQAMQILLENPTPILTDHVLVSIAGDWLLVDETTWQRIFGVCARAD